MNTRIGKLGSAALSLLLFACMDEPRSGTTVPAVGPTHFSGYVTRARDVVTLEAAPSASGPFSAWPGSTTRADGSAGPSVGGTSLFHWSVDSAVPDSLFSGGCLERSSYVRARSSDGLLVTSLGSGQLSCLQTHILFAGLTGALDRCLKNAATVVRLDRTLGANPLQITTQAEADAIACVEVWRTDLTLTPASGTTLHLPNLRRVDGDLRVTLPISPAPGGIFTYPDSRCGQGEQAWSTVLTRAHLPALAGVGGDLRVEVPATGTLPTTGGEAIELGLDALVTVEGDVNIDLNEANAVMPCGLSNLSAISGSLAVTLGVADGYPYSGFLGSLSDVGQDVTLQRGNSLGNYFPALATVGGTFSFLDNTSPTIGAVGAALQSVDSLRIERTGLDALSGVGSPSLRVHNQLAVRGNPFLSELGTSVVMQPGATFTLGTGVDNNAALPQAEVCSFIDFQVSSHGWTPAGSFGSCP